MISYSLNNHLWFCYPRSTCERFSYSWRCNVYFNYMCVWATSICFDAWWEHSKPTTVTKVTSRKMHLMTQSKEDKQYTNNIWLNTSAILLNQQMSLYQSNGSPCTTLKATNLLSYKLLKKITWACIVDLIICAKYLVMIVGLRTMAAGVVVKGINLGCRSSLDIKLSFSRYIFQSRKKSMNCLLLQCWTSSIHTATTFLPCCLVRR